MLKILQNIEEAEKIIKKTNHLLYVTYPFVKDKRLLLKIILELKQAISKNINAILQYEHIRQRISLTSNSKSNFEIFETQCAKKYSITNEEIEQILELFLTVKKHKDSSVEFLKDEKLVMLGENQNPTYLQIEKIKEFQTLAIKILEKTKNSLKTKA
ncbi:hypothetical protein J4481_02050 [Candidatus Pacearchaeota archaeon]|nr:hypothetical protein [Candidatus Pacearchaeota archaeon]